MSGFVPVGYQKCSDVLSEMHTGFLTEEDWATLALGKYDQRCRLMSKPREMAVETLHKLQSEILSGKRTAWTSDSQGLLLIEAPAFASEAATDWLATGRHSLGGPLLIGPAANEQADGDSLKLAQSKQNEAAQSAKAAEETLVKSLEPKKAGAKNKSRDAALVYWGMFPNGHGVAEKKVSWDRAEDLVNAQLTNLGLKTIARNQFRKVVGEMGHVDPVTGQPKAP